MLNKYSVINQQFIDCSGNTNQDVLLSWCQIIFVYQEKDLTNPHLPMNYYVIMGRRRLVTGIPKLVA